MDEKNTSENNENNVDLRKLGNKTNDTADEYLKLRLNNYKNGLSKIIKNRYTTEPFLMQQSNDFKQQQQLQQQHDTNRPSTLAQLRQINKTSPKHMTNITRINKSIGPFYEQHTQHYSGTITKPENIVIYNKNIDNLTADLLSAFNNGINKDLLAREKTPTSLSCQNKLNSILSSQIKPIELSHNLNTKTPLEPTFRTESSIREEADFEDNEIDSNQSNIKNVNMETFYPENYSCTDNFSDQEDFPDDEEYIGDEYFDDENQLSDYEDERIIFGIKIKFIQ